MAGNILILYTMYASSLRAVGPNESMVANDRKIDLKKEKFEPGSAALNFRGRWTFDRQLHNKYTDRQYSVIKSQCLGQKNI